MYITLLDRMVPSLLERQVLDTKNVDLAERWAQWIMATEKKTAPEAVIGAFWDPYHQLGCLEKSEMPFKLAKDPAPYYHQTVQSGGNKKTVRIVDIAVAASIAWLFLYLYQTERSQFYNDDLLKQRGILALDFIARTVLNGGKILGCFDLGLTFFCEAFLLIRNSLDENRANSFKRAIERSVNELSNRMEDEWLVLFKKPGEHNHQILTSYSILLSGVALGNQEMIDKGTKGLEENIGYLKMGFSEEHDRKYEYFTCAPLLRAAEITGNKKFIEVVEKTIAYNANLVTRSGEIVELISLRPTGSGGGWGYGCACYVYERLAAIKKDPIYKGIAITLQRYLASKQRQDGLFQGMIYSPEPEQNVGSMCAFFNTGSNIHGLIWADQTQSQVKPAYRREKNTFFGHEEKIVGYQKGALSYYACGSDQGPKDLLWIDNMGPGITGFTCLVETKEGTKGGLGGFTRNLSIDESYWKVTEDHEEMSIFQKIKVIEKEKEFGAARFVTHVYKSHIAIFSWISSDHADYLVSGPNVRASIGSLSYRTSEGETDSFMALKNKLNIKGALDISAAGRSLHIRPLSLEESDLIITPAIGSDTPYLHLVPGRCHGVHVKTKGNRQNIVWVIADPAKEKYSLPICEGSQMVQALLMLDKQEVALLVVNHEMVEAGTKITFTFPYTWKRFDVETTQNNGVNVEWNPMDKQATILFDGKENPLLKPKSVMHLKIKPAQEGGI